jgi:DNA (cytosine-5)-methyltransferase 3A
LKGEKSKLFYEFADCLEHVQPEYFLLENVLMDQESQDIITDRLGVEPIYINSNHFSAQDRPRLYWTNIPFNTELPNNETVFAYIMEQEVDENYYYDDEFEVWNGLEKRMVGSLKRRYPNGKVKLTETTSRVYHPDFKMACLTAVSGGHQEKKVYVNGRTRKVTPLEYERLQTVPDGYTASMSDSQRYKMLGNGWTVDVIAHIFKGIEQDNYQSLLDKLKTYELALNAVLEESTDQAAQNIAKRALETA